MEDFFSGSDRMLQALQEPTISPEQERVEEQSEVDEETPLLKEVLYQLAEIKGMLRSGAGAAKTETQVVPDYTSQLLENI